MIVGLDSSFPPSPATALQAKAGGIALWSGYISSAPYDGQSHFGLYHPWPREGFEYARLCGATPIAFCSGWDAPGTLKTLAAAWNVRLCLDIESGIRPDGPWKQPFLDALRDDARGSGGVYGNDGCHVNCRAPFHVRAAYPGSGDVQATWGGPVPRPSVPCGWQWAGTHTEFGVGVDRGDYDDFFLGENMAETDDIYSILTKGTTVAGSSSAISRLAADVAAIKADVATIKADGSGTATNLTPILNAIADLKAHPTVQSDPALLAKVDALGKHLGVGVP